MKKWLRIFYRQGRWRKLFNKIKRKKRKYILILAAISLLIILLYLVLMMSRVSTARINFLALKNSFKNSYPCHESCLLKRRELRKEVISNWKTERKLSDDWLKYWKISILEKDYTLQKELLNIAVAVRERDYLEEVLTDNLLNKTIDEKTKANIINIYLISLDDPNLSSYYISIIKSSKEDLQVAAIRAISSLSDKSRALKIQDAPGISDLILDERTSANIRLDLFFLLFDYEALFPEEVNKLFIFIYEDSSDKVIQYIAAEHLIKLGQNDFLLPYVTQGEWDAYFNY